MTLHTLASTGERVDDVVVVHMLPVTGLDRRHQSAVTDSLGRERENLITVSQSGWSTLHSGLTGDMNQKSSIPQGNE